MLNLNKIARDEQEKLEAIKLEMISDLAQTPDFPAVHSSANTFTLSSSEIGAIWSAKYHNRDCNIRTVSDLIRSATSSVQIHARCQKLLETGKYKEQPLHPILLTHIKTWYRNDG